MFLTAKGDVLDRIRGLNAGADDYLVKPFDPMEAVARVSATLRRVHGYDLAGGQKELTCGDLEVTMEVVDSFEFGRMEESFNTMVQGLREAREQQNANEEKNRKLYAEIAHDLKTPMAVTLYIKRGYCRDSKGS